MNQDNFVHFDPFALVDADTFRFLLVPAIAIATASLLIVLLISLRRSRNKAAINRAINLELSEKKTKGDALSPIDDSSEEIFVSIAPKAPQDASNEAQPSPPPPLNNCPMSKNGLLTSRGSLAA